MDLITIAPEWKKEAQEFEDIAFELFLKKYGIDPNKDQLRNEKSKLKVRVGLFERHWFNFANDDARKKISRTEFSDIPNCLLALNTEKKFNEFLEKCKKVLEDTVDPETPPF